jgi:hypothetical protein
MVQKTTSVDAEWEEDIYGKCYGRHEHEGEMAVVED